MQYHVFLHPFLSLLDPDVLGEQSWVLREHNFVSGLVYFLQVVLVMLGRHKVLHFCGCKVMRHGVHCYLPRLLGTLPSFIIRVYSDWALLLSVNVMTGENGIINV